MSRREIAATVEDDVGWVGVARPLHAAAASDSQTINALRITPLLSNAPFEVELKKHGLLASPAYAAIERNAAE